MFFVSSIATIDIFAEVSGKRSVIILLCVLWGLIWLGLPACSGDETPSGDPYRNHAPEAQYVGPEVCGGCHADKMSTFSGTGMGKSFRPADGAHTDAIFTRHQVIHDSATGYSYYPELLGDHIYITEFRLEGQDTLYKRTEKVDYIIGSGHHTNSHLINRNGYIYQAPLTFYTQQGTWDLPPGFEKGQNSRFYRAIGEECMSCHNSYAGFEEGSGNRFLNVPHGISCERCHGPGSIHVEEKRSGKLVNTVTDIDYSIVNPGKLPWKQQVDVCQRCHLQGNAVLMPGKTWTSFRPGMDLDRHIQVFAPEYEGGDGMIMASHAQRLAMSQCFLQSNQTGGKPLTCITCHNPHVSVKVTGTNIFNAACQKCHADGSCQETPEKRKAKGNQCATCHMPVSGTGDIPHVTVHDHYIRSKPQPNGTPSTVKIFKGLRCLNHANPTDDARAVAWMNAWEQSGNHQHTLDSAALYISKLEASSRRILSIRLYYLREEFARALALGKAPQEEQDGWTAYRLGEAALQTGQPEQAWAYFSRAVKLEPGRLEFMEKVGATMILTGKPDAENYIKMILKKNEDMPRSWHNLAYVYMKQRKFKEAISCAQRALSLDPLYIQALEQLAGIYEIQGDQTALKKTVQRILKLNPNHPARNLK